MFLKQDSLKTSTEAFPSRTVAKPVFFGLFAFLSFLAVSVSFGLPILTPLVLFLGAFSFFLFFTKPQAFLFALIFVRMSLDYTSQYFTVSILERSFTLSELFGIAIAVIGIITVLQKGKDLPKFRLLPAFILIGLWGAVSLFFSIMPSSTLRDLLRIFDLFTFAFLAFVTVRNRADFKRLLEALFITFIIPLGVGFYQYAAGIGFQDESSPIPRIFGTFAHPNVFSLALFTVFALAVLYRTEFAKTTKSRVLTVIFLGATGLAMLLTLSRVAWLATAVFFLIIAVFRNRKLLLPMILLPIFFLALSGTLRERVMQSFDLNPDSSIAWRLTLWSDNIRKTFIDGREWYGYGLETFPSASEELRGIALGSNDAHNDFVKFFVEGGYTGLATFLTFIGLIFLPLSRRYKNATDTGIKTVFGIIIVALIAIEFSAFSDNVFRNTPLWIIFFTATGGALGAFRAPQEEDPS